VLIGVAFEISILFNGVRSLIDLFVYYFLVALPTLGLLSPLVFDTDLLGVIKSFLEFYF